MTVHHITANTTTSTGDGLDMLGGDTLKIDAGVTLSSTDPAGKDGAFSTGGNNTVKIYGTLTGTSNAFEGLAGNDVFHVYSTGQVLAGLGAAIKVGGGTNTLINSGTIGQGTIATGGSPVIWVGNTTSYCGGNLLINHATGTISTLNKIAVYFQDGTDTIHNDGSINSGSGSNAIYIGDVFGGGNNSIVNSGSIETMGDGGGWAVNTFGSGNMLTNSGTISSSATSGGAIQMGGGSIITNTSTGTISYTASFDPGIHLHGGNNTVSNSGNIDSYVLLGTNAQSDSFLGATGTLNGIVLGGSGNDTIEVGSGNSSVFGGLGADFLQGGLGHTTFIYTTVSESNSTGSYGTNMDTVDDFNAGSFGGRDKLQFVSNFGTMTFGTHIAWDGHVDGMVNMASFATDLANAIGTTLAANGAVLVHASPGTSLAGDYFLVVDGNATIGFQSGSDYVVELTNMTAPSHLHLDLFWGH